jgi:LacI family transcriptional regulator
MGRPTIADLARAAGVSISTVDRVINSRDPARRPTAERVMAAATEIGFHHSGAISHRLGHERPKKHFGLLLQQHAQSFYQGLSQALTDAVKASPIVRGTCSIVFADDLEPAAVGERIERLGQTVDAIAVVVANHPRIASAIDRLVEGGIPVVALI